MNKKLATNDPWIAGITRALRRASDRALRLAKATGTPFWIVKNGRLVNLNPTAEKLPKSRAGTTKAKRR